MQLPEPGSLVKCSVLQGRPGVVGLRVVGTIHKFCFADGTRDRAMPSVITGGAQKRLVHGSTIDFLAYGTHVQDEIQRVSLFFLPKRTPCASRHKLTCKALANLLAKSSLGSP